MFDKHLFICTTTRSDSAACGNQGSAQMRDELKAWAKTNCPGQKIRVNAAGCLGLCEKGIAAVLYPQGEWFTDLKNNEEDKNQLKEVLAKT